MNTRNDHDRHPMNQDMPADIDRVLLLYLDALDRQDWETFGAIWQQAETDAELERALREVHRGIIEEDASGADWDSDAEAVRELAVLHFPERPPADDPGEVERPLTAGDVAGRLAADIASGAVRMTEADRQANARLQGDATPLPSQLKQSAIEGWCESLPVQAGTAYWREFRKAALQLVMARSQSLARLAAAREQTPPSQSTAKPPAKPSTPKPEENP